MVNVYDGDSNQNNVMYLKWAKDQIERRSTSAWHICVLIPAIILAFLR